MGSTEPTKPERTPTMTEENTATMPDRLDSGIPASFAPTLNDHMSELGFHLANHITKVQLLRETLSALEISPAPTVERASTSGPGSPDPQALSVSGELDVKPDINVPKPDASSRHKSPAPHIVIDVAGPPHTVEKSNSPRCTDDSVPASIEIIAHIHELDRFLCYHLNNIASLQSSLSTTPYDPTMAASNHTLSTVESGVDSGSAIYNPTLRTKEDWERRKLREEHKMWAQVFSTIVVISTFLTATVISALSLGRDVWEDNTSTTREYVVQFGSTSFLCAFTTTVIASVSAAKSAYASHPGFRGRLLPGIPLRLFLCGGGLSAGFISLFLTVNMTIPRFLKPDTAENRYSISPGLIFLSVLLLYVYFDVFGHHHYRWLEGKVGSVWKKVRKQAM
ncbi:hypothetical protein FPV67DRAFT_1672596 [Lyophyllum atratum]|nr:hypothetical protein FPV67DRAFT_1672596 [Lyophyllum atratum]